MNEENKRTYSRVNTLLPFQVRRLHPEDRKELKSRVSRNTLVINATPPPPLQDEDLVDWLTMLNNKLDYLINLLSPQREGFVSMSFEPLNISGSGMRLNTSEPFNLGEILEIRMVLEAYPSKVLHLFGEVVRMEAMVSRPGTYSVGVRFVGMSDEVRNEIVKFDFKKHKEKLLKKKAPSAASGQ